ncbi:hypothetical protein ACFY1P_34070 [Streptomyces sp. NPDC001407]|uniref:hypothetical protein n=1 Tax=Streptomyces sp. NPDC001407 TaxID=3364573 RepID=UPI0036ADC8BF
MELKIAHQDALTSASMLAGRPSTGKTLPRDASVQVCMDVLNRVVIEIESRESAREMQQFPGRRWRAESVYYLVVDEERLLAEHPANGALRDLIATIRQRGPAVDVILRDWR